MTELAQPQQPSRPLIIAIDGPAGAGKSTVARLLAERLDLPYLDTGAMYRAAALLAQRAGIEPPFAATAGEAIANLLANHRLEVRSAKDSVTVTIDGDDVSQEIRSPECSRLTSAVSALSEVRRALVQQQRRMSAETGGVVEGRDIGTVVFPDADLKVFLTADSEERAHRRHLELRSRGTEASLQQIRCEQEERDRRDSSRADSPLRAAEGSHELDTTGMNQAQVIQQILDQIQALPDQCLTAVGRTP